MNPYPHDEFYEWLDDVAMLLPPLMKVSEARLIFERKIKEENEINNEKAKKDLQSSL